MIHYPAVYFEQQGGKSLEKVKTFLKSEKKVAKCSSGREDGLNSSETVSEFKANHLNSKRRLEEHEEDNSKSKRLKGFPANDDYFKNEHAINYSRRQHSPCVNETAPIRPSCRQGQRAASQEPTQNKYDFLQMQTLVNKLPELKPKLNGEANTAHQPSKHTSNGKLTTRTNPWGPQSYSDLISNAISSFPYNRATLQQIYEWIVCNVPHFADKADYPSTKGWKV
jgi:forkhead box protein O3